MFAISWRAVLSSTSTSTSEQQQENTNKVIKLFSLVRGVAGLESDSKTRLRIVSIRLQCLYILIHSRISRDRLGTYIQPNSQLLKDTVALADIFSEASTQLIAPGEIHSNFKISTVALECVTGLLELVIRKRTKYDDTHGILRELRLHRHVEAPGPPEDVWCTIVMSASTVATDMFDEYENRHQSS